jgi:hypothetical protein
MTRLRYVGRVLVALALSLAPVGLVLGSPGSAWAAAPSCSISPVPVIDQASLDSGLEGGPTVGAGVTVTCAGLPPTPEVDFVLALQGGFLGGACYTNGSPPPDGNYPSIPSSFSLLADQPGATRCGFNAWWSAERFPASNWPPVGTLGLYTAAYDEAPEFATGVGTASGAAAPAPDPVAVQLSSSKGAVTNYVADGIAVVAGILLVGLGVFVLVRYFRKAQAAA